MKNYYSILGVRETADCTEIKKAYRNLMRKWHPDVNRSKDATSRTEEVNIAYSVLSCPESRYTHDLQLRKAGLSSKPLYIKLEYPCGKCRQKGFIRIYSSSIFDKIKNWLGIKVAYEDHMCLDCCGTGINRKIEEY